MCYHPDLQMWILSYCHKQWSVGIQEDKYLSMGSAYLASLCIACRLLRTRTSTSEPSKDVAQHGREEG